MADNFPKPMVTCCKRNDIRTAAPGVRATGNEILFVEEEDGSCTVMGTDDWGNAVDLRNAARLSVTAADGAFVNIDMPHYLTPESPPTLNFIMRGLSRTEPGKPALVTVAITPIKDSYLKHPVTIDLPCNIAQEARRPNVVPAIVVTPTNPIVRGTGPDQAFGGDQVTRSRAEPLMPTSGREVRSTEPLTPIPQPASPTAQGQPPGPGTHAVPGAVVHEG